MCLECASLDPTFDSNENLLCLYCGVALFQLGESPPDHYLRCLFAQQGATTYGRKDHLTCHIRDRHKMNDLESKRLASAGRYPVGNPTWPKQCGFWKVEFNTWDERMFHIAAHYQEGRRISEWRLPFPAPKDFRPRDQNFRPTDGDSDDDGDDDFHGGSGYSHCQSVVLHGASSSLERQDNQPRGYHGSGYPSYGHRSRRQHSERTRYLTDKLPISESSGYKEPSWRWSDMSTIPRSH